MSRPVAPQLLILTIARALAPAGETPMPSSARSPASREGAAIPVKHTCDGADVSPPLAWSGAPPSAAAFALIVDDPDAPAGTWVHWVLYNLPGTAAGVPENVAKTDQLPNLGGALQGRNDFRRPGYGGPLPPPGPGPRHFFKLYAPDPPPSPKPGGAEAGADRAARGPCARTRRP